MHRELLLLTLVTPYIPGKTKEGLLEKEDGRQIE